MLKLEAQGRPLGLRQALALLGFQGPAWREALGQMLDDRVKALGDLPQGEREARIRLLEAAVARLAEEDGGIESEGKPQVTVIQERAAPEERPSLGQRFADRLSDETARTLASAVLGAMGLALDRLRGGREEPRGPALTLWSALQGLVVLVAAVLAILQGWPTISRYLWPDAAR